jgi:hypothetical protein
MSQRIRFSASFPGVVDNLKVKMGEEFSPLGLSVVEEFHHHTIFKVFIVTQDLDWMQGAF